MYNNLCTPLKQKTEVSYSSYFLLWYIHQTPFHIYVYYSKTVKWQSILQKKTSSDKKCKYRPKLSLLLIKFEKEDKKSAEQTLDVHPMLA